MGYVYLADDLRLEQPVAIKLLYPWSGESPDQRERLLDEVRFARRVSHANVCRVYDVGESDEHLFLVMEHIDGINLREMLAHGPLPEDQAVEVSVQICRGLAAIHEQGLLHRDLKPANVMIDADGHVRLTDFGLAVSAEAAGEGRLIAGTPAYMAPEQLLGEVSVRSDIYALGMVLHEIFTGRRAYPRQSLIKLARRYWTDEPSADPSSAPLQLAELDPGVAHLISWCLATNPDDRPASAAAVEAALLPETGLRTLNGHVLAEGEDERTLRTLLVSDLVSSTALVEMLGDARAAEVFQHHDLLARDLLRAYNGVEIDKTDGFLLLFERPLDAVVYALAYHQGLQELSAEIEVTLASRVGIHLGELYLRRNPAEHVARGAKPIEVEGLAKAIAARLMSVAGGGQTLLTRGAFDLARRAAVGEVAGEEMEWLAHGRYLLKGVDEPVDVFEVGRRGIAPLAAPADSEKVKRLVGDESILGWRPAPEQTLPGRKHWRMESKLGEGGFGEVWLAQHAKTSEQRVFKFCFEAEHLRSLRREVTLFRLLKEELGERHDIARVIDWSFDEPPYYLESEYAAGGSLIEWADGQGGIDHVPLEVRLELVAQAAEALGAAHSVGVLHKDIKPRNILISTGPDGKPQVRLTDFGIGRVTDRKRLEEAGITVLGMTETADESDSSSGAGSRLYMAPEVLEGKAGTLQADIYALGVVLYQMVVGDLGRALAPGWQRGIPGELLVEDIAACVDGDPRSRLASAGDLADRLRQLDTRRQERRRQEQAEQALEALTRSRQRRRVFAAAFLLLSAFTVWNVVERRRAERESRLARAQYLVSQAQMHVDSDRSPAYLAAALRVWPQAIELAATHDVLNEMYLQLYYPRQVLSMPETGSWDAQDGRFLAFTSDDHMIYLQDLRSGEVRVLEGHEKKITDVSFSRDGNLLASSSWDNTVRLWDVNTGEERDIKTLEGYAYGITFSPDGKLLAGSLNNETVRLWDLRSGDVRVFEGNQRRSLEFSPDGAFLVSCGTKLKAGIVKGMRLWDVSTGEMRVFEVEEDFRDPISIVSFSPDSEVLATASLRSVRLWNINSGEVRILEGHVGAIYDMSFSPDGATLAASDDDTVRLWYVSTGRAHVLKGHNETVKHVSFSPDGELLASASQDGAVRLWSTRNYMSCIILKGHEDIVYKASFSPDSSILLTASSDRTVRLWDVRKGELRYLELDDKRKRLSKTAYSRDGSLLAGALFAHSRDSICIWDLNTGGVQVLGGHEGHISHMAFSPGGAFLAVASETAITLWNVESGDHLTFDEHEDPILHISFSPDERLLASCSSDKTVRLWDVGTGEARILEGIERAVVCFSFSPDSNLLASGSFDTTIRLWNLHSYESRILGKHDRPVTHVSFSPDGAILASCSVDSTVRLWDILTGKAHTLEGHDSSVEQVSFSPDGALLASCSYDKTVRLWDLQTGQARVLEGHKSTVEAVSFSPDGALLASSGMSTVRIWDVRTGESRVVDFTGLSLDWLLFSPDREQLLTYSYWGPTPTMRPLPRYLFPNQEQPVWLISSTLPTDEIIDALEAFSNYRYDESTDSVQPMPFTGIQGSRLSGETPAEPSLLLVVPEAHDPRSETQSPNRAP
jgi:WD40 repeat protein/serine/threonine protein kinase